MSFAYLPFYTGDYFRDTRGLSMAGHGCYILFLTYCWDSKGPLPLDNERLAGICEARNQEERLTMQRILLTYFVRMEDGWYNSRMQREIDRAEAISTERADAGRRGANQRMQRFRESQASAKQLLGKSQASDAIPNPIPSPASTPTPKRPKALSGSQANADAIRLLEFLNQKTGRRFRPSPTTLKPILARLQEYSFDECRGVIVRRWVKWKDDDKMRDFLRPSTLFGATNFAQYVGDVPTKSEIEAENADQKLP